MWVWLRSLSNGAMDGGLILVMCAVSEGTVDVLTQQKHRFRVEKERLDGSDAPCVQFNGDRAGKATAIGLLWIGPTSFLGLGALNLFWQDSVLEGTILKSLIHQIGIWSLLHRIAPMYLLEYFTVDAEHATDKVFGPEGWDALHLPYWVLEIPLNLLIFFITKHTLTQVCCFRGYAMVNAAMKALQSYEELNMKRQLREHLFPQETK
eukprot:NODE_7178_length_786_cov_68.945701_g6939_i0.p1 GENE.NODE_7178_length_786_cov_68.945701_g6939_i0~~NODE_7178_length_786_cov_68.945701_g6939_i0.p1  ORF type:complete len:207 (+),score=13.75 NODE_7178_length_786_cov_68.945701_g6939_i0:48-668(+)